MRSCSNHRVDALRLPSFFVKVLVICLCMVCALAPALASAGAPMLTVPVSTQPSLSAALEALKARDALERVANPGIGFDKEIRLGDWYLHPQKFIFRVPEDMEIIGKFKSETVLLVDTSDVNKKDWTTIYITISKPHKMSDFTENKVRSAYSTQFNRFSLLSITDEAFCGQDGVRLCFLSDNAPQMLVQQCLFNKDGRGYNVTMTVENNFTDVRKGVAQFVVFCNEMEFAGSLEDSGL